MQSVKFRKFLKFSGTLAVLGALVVIGLMAAMPWLDRYGATAEELAATYHGDELVSSPIRFYTRAVSIAASPEEVYPWIVQLGADRGGMYSYTWFETNILQCELVNADRIHTEWQDLQVGDKVKMCPNENMPPAYEVALIEKDQTIVLGHKEQDTWVEVWQFNLVPQADGTTRLVIRSRSAAQGWFWDAIRPGEFIMMQRMMLGIKERAEKMDGS